MYGIGHAFIIPILSAAVLLYAYGWIAVGLVLARLVPPLRERYRYTRFVAPIILLALMWTLGSVSATMAIGINLGAIVLGSVGLILTRKMVPKYKVEVTGVLDELLLAQSDSTKNLEL